MMTQGTRKQTTEPILGTPILGMAILGAAFPWCVRLSSNIPVFVSVDLIGENNQVILEYQVYPFTTDNIQPGSGQTLEYVSYKQY